ncbi:hypothetical protein Dimus_005987 [Dionaea muscipula]
MVVAEEFLFGSCILSTLLYLIRLIKVMATRFKIIPLSPSSPLSWVAQIIVNQLGESLASKSQAREDSEITHSAEKWGGVQVQEKVSSGPENDVFECSAAAAAVLENVKLRKVMRPSMLVVPETAPAVEFRRESMKMKNVEFEVQGREYCLVSRKGRKETMEDRYQIITDIAQDSNQLAFFAVIDGHGGHAAAEYVAEYLGKNIVKSLEKVAKADVYGVEQAIHEGYSVTDEEFLAQGVGSGACAASVLFKDGVLHVANVGDCRVVLSRKGVADILTNDHLLIREDERTRIEDLGGYVDCHNGVWRVEGSLAVSRAIGDLHLKKWIISEPEVARLQPASDCEFLIMASDGLWNKVDEQEAVGIITRDGVSMQSCKKLIDTSCSRGNKDDITVMLINLQKILVI